jgi:pyridoxal phosphate enzyme (YggS family)
MSTLAQRLQQVERRIAAACEQHGRPRDSVTLVAVSKRKPVSAIRQAYALGVRDFGENYAQELQRKAEDLRDLEDLRWHFIGHVQRNKAQLLVGRCELLHAVDSVALLDRIEHLAQRKGVIQQILLQLNVSGEDSKSGARVEDLSTLLAHARELGHVRCAGLMTMPPFTEDPHQVRPLFERLRQLRDAQTSPAALPWLSIGMSHDFEVAIAQGATHIRIGSLIFGPRD